MKKIIISIAILFISTVNLLSQEKELDTLILERSNTDMAFLTDSVRREATINDYNMIGVYYGAALNNVMWNPSIEQQYLFTPINAGITYTRYGKMFNYMPYFGFQASLTYSQEGYHFKKEKKTGLTPTLFGANKAIIEVVELPILAHIHADFWKLKLLANIGCYGGYRIGIERFGPGVDPATKSSFLDTDIRFDYGIKGGVGFGLIFDPVEIHVQGMYKYSMSSLFQPDYRSEYYYQYGNPNSIIISVGLHIHLSKRIGKSKASIRRQAKLDLGIIQGDYNDEE